MELKNNHKLVLITGATGGLGSELTYQFMKEGYNVFVVGRNKQKLQALKDKYKNSFPGKIEYYRADFKDLSSRKIEELLLYCKDFFSYPDILINNAGVTGGVGKSYELPYSEYMEALQINFGLVVELCRVCVPAMIEKKYGKIIQISGGGATGPRENFSPYAISKTALLRFSENLSKELDVLRPDVNIDVNSVAPGAMKTAMTEEILKLGMNKIGEKEFKGLSKKLETEPTHPEIPAKLCLFLASKRSDGITGRIISANWDKWEEFPEHIEELQNSDIYTLRRIIAKDRNKDWDK